MLECCEIMGKVGSSALSLWFADGTNYAGQDSLRARKRRFEDGLTTLYRHLPAGGRMLIEYKFFEPAFYHTDLGDWGMSMLVCQKLGKRAQVIAHLGQGVTASKRKWYGCSGMPALARAPVALPDSKMGAGIH